ncbi:MAG: hypothetical protein LW645_10230 [Verrucomicrobiaceae bacterium]|nr:hypothetical protein [Verrucomicrobiaceae bacterium]
MFRLALLFFATAALAEDWPQFMFNAAHSGNAAQIELDVEKLGLQGAVAMTDGIYTPRPWSQVARCMSSMARAARPVLTQRR